MTANFNLSVVSSPLQGNYLQYKDAQGITLLIPDNTSMAQAMVMTQTLLQNYIAHEYTKKTYPAKSLVFHNMGLFYNPNAISTAEDWTAAHWTATTVENYIKLMTTT